MYDLYNITLHRYVPYRKPLNTLQEARFALHHLTQRQNSCILLMDPQERIHGVRVSKQSKHHFPRGFFAKYKVYLGNMTLCACDKETSEVLHIFPVEEL